VSGIHVEPRIHARTTRSLADLIHQHLLQPVDIGVGEMLSDALVRNHVADEIIDHRDDRALAAQSFIERPVFLRILPGTSSQGESNQQNNQCTKGMGHLPCLLQLFLQSARLGHARIPVRTGWDT